MSDLNRSKGRPVTRRLEIMLVSRDARGGDALAGAPFLRRLNVIEDAGCAIPRILREAPFEEAARPDLILLDLDHVGEASRVMTALAEDPFCRGIPVIGISTSGASPGKAHEVGELMGCIAKPLRAQELGDMIATMDSTPHACNGTCAVDTSRERDQRRTSQRMEAIGQLAGGIAHDVNNMLTIIQSNAQVVSVSTDPSEIVESAKEIREATARGANLMRQLLTVSQPDAMMPAPLDLREVIDGFSRMLRRVLGDQVRLDVRHAERLPLVDADVGMLEQVLLNLAINARDAMPDGGTLVVRLEPVTVTATAAKLVHRAYPGTFVCLAVEDTGTGIAPEHLARIWEPFFTTKESGKGTGIGLATVSSIAEQHRGWIQARSAVGAGTTFELFLPVSSSSLPAETTRSEAGGIETILFAEDDQMIRTMVTRLLAAEGYRVIPAASGLDALAVWREHRDEIDLLLTDVMMPDGTRGDHLAADLTAMRPGLQVVFLSGNGPEFNRGLVLEQGVNFLHKPFRLADLLRTVRAALDRAKHAR